MASSDTTISRLTIGGFKSFADEVRVEILPGLTGIVGPNGCGKSNVVEALRWAMGESSARALRGGELDDLIFAGTSTRSARNLAQVTLHITNARGLAPAPFHEADELEVTRKAERGSGSEYRINGRTTRARDVQTLFADLASGARSSAIVSQNRVGLLIAAKPEERRLLLEEAAGITGLHARRHDAELKLRQTETNLSRAEDLRLQLEERLEALSEQSGQAKIYRELSDQIRALEVSLHALMHARANRAVQRSRDDLARAKEALKEAERASEAAQIADFQIRAALPAARKASEDARSKVENQRLVTETTRHDLTRAQDAVANATERLNQTEDDLADLTARLDQDKRTARDIHNELTQLDTERSQAPQQHAELSTQAAQLALQEAAAQETYTTAQRHYDLESVQQEALKHALSALSARLEQERQAYTTAEDEHCALQTQLADGPSLPELQKQTQAAYTAADNARQTEHASRQSLQEARLSLEQATRAVDEAKTRYAQEQKTLKDLLQRITATQERQKSDLQDRQTAQATLITPQQRDAFISTFLAAQEQLAHATEAEHSANATLDAQNALWVQARAAAAAGQQQHTAMQHALQNAEKRLNLTQQRYENALAQHKRCTAEQPDAALLTQATHAAQHSEQTLADCEADIIQSEADLVAYRADAEQTLNAEQSLENSLLKKRSQAEGLTQSLKTTTKNPSPLADALIIPAHLTHAVAAALAEGLDASLAADDVPATRRWNRLPALAGALPPAQLTPLSQILTVPAATRRCFEHIFLLEPPYDGAALQPLLQPGQSIVSTQGALWRWDGYYRAATSEDPAAALIERRRLLASLQADIAFEAEQLPLAKQQRQASQATLHAANAALAALRHKRVAAEHALSNARRTLAECTQNTTRAKDRSDAAAQLLQETQYDLEEAKKLFQHTHDALAELPSPDGLIAAATQHAEHVQTAQNALNACRQRRHQAQNALDFARNERDQAFLQHNTAEERLKHLEHNLERTEQDLTAWLHAADEHQKICDGIDLEALNTQASFAQSTLTAAQNALQNASQHSASTQAIAQQSRAELSAREHILTTASARLAVLTPHKNGLSESLARLEQEHATQTSAFTHRPALTALATARDAAFLALNDKKDAHQQAQQSLADCTHDAVRRESTIASLQSRLRDITPQITATAERHETLTARLAALRTEHDAALVAPEQITADLQRHEHALRHAEEVLEAARLNEVVAEEKAQTSQEKLYQLNQTLSEGRASIARLTERAEHAEATRTKLHAESDAPDPLAPYPQDLSETAETTSRRRLARLIRDREALGPVNLRADLEYQEARKTADTIAHEHAELTQAIARLRGAIGSINKEGRERLTAVFSAVDQHFQSLFSRMFGGGRAHLGLVGSDDPLEAGLEIFAQPPGKKLSTLSLLSGGEQALTALSLIFATFRCNPAPICVLDEVDAPLDDANVERFCALLMDMTKEAGTRFLVVTHHQLTMAHMDRLYGVTMQERGVSRVLSVDLKRATAMVDGV
ncbi:chromosome partition protein Smc [Neokomagataea thailandica NBRC 106555]|uniref:Chromosome partition protein Smc n=2 Tax=Neokomagataea TaxID=1223423 RepID=A0A4Y6V2P2_9PROT|nr:MULTISPECIES: AAA family ATPase [Neokomagataea]QDH24299.1 chromosome segregation protein SMC [Neokomagataea tanensis]GBR53076.1 chromosome partition protein Smc [Neokomagataea thailandica NBRC 106555]